MQSPESKQWHGSQLESAREREKVARIISYKSNEGETWYREDCYCCTRSKKQQCLELYGFWFLKKIVQNQVGEKTKTAHKILFFILRPISKNV